MKKICKNCGCELHIDSRFCKNCGAAIEDVPAERQSMPRYTKTRGGGGSRALCIALAFLLVIQTAAVALYGWPGLLVKGRDTWTSENGIEGSESGVPIGLSNIRLTQEDYAVEPAIVNVGPKQTVAQEKGITVDFGTFNLMEDGALEIRDMGVKSEGKDGFSARCFDLSLGDVTEFPTYVTVTLPYEPAAGSVGGPFVQYYNNGAWEPVYFVLNEAAGTVTLYTDHFSTFGLFEYTSGVNAGGPLTKVEIPKKNLDLMIAHCDNDWDDFLTMMKTNSPEDSGLIKTALTALEGTGNLLSSGEYTTGFMDKMIELSSSGSSFFPEDGNKLLGKIGAGLTAVKVGLSWYKSGNVTETFKAHKYDLTELAIGTAGSALGAAPLTVAAAGVWMAGMMDSTITNLINNGYDSPAEHVYQEFTWNYVAYSKIAKGFVPKLHYEMTARAYLDEEMVDARVVDDKLWASLIEREYKKYSKDPQKMQAATEKLLDAYANTFWRLKPKVRNRLSLDIHGVEKWKEPTTQEREKLVAALKAQLRYRLKDLFAGIYNRYIINAKQQLLCDVQALENQMNAVTTFRAFGINEDGDEVPLSETQYKDYTAAFALSPDAPPTVWSWRPGSSEDTTYACTLYNYLALGSPAYIKFYETWEDQVADKAAFTMQFTFSVPEVKLVVKNEGLSIDEIVGIYDGTVTADGDSQSHSFTVQRNGNGIVMDDTMDTVKLQYDSTTGIASGSKSGPYGEYTLRYTYRFTFTQKGETISITGTSSAYLDDEFQATANFSCHKID